MAESTETDPRYHAAYQRGYDGPEPERLTRAEERFRRPRRDGGGAARSVAEPVVPQPPEARPERESPFAALSFVADQTPSPLADQARPLLAGTPVDPDVPPVPGPAPTAALFATRRVSLTLAAVGTVLIAVGLLTLWRSAQSWYSSSPIQNTFGVEQYLRELTNTLTGPCLTVGLVALCFSVLVPLVRAVRR
ncbi:MULTISPECIES: hypothetical protein [unclassified Rathayibacter]|uniref:hypothetical protein n=1 Tax=unclassified Rathayibacter TaxID=2609250 RepID=UPI0006F1C548|nr:MULTISPECIES: hypothetical protein [unclassified Rathayibacter]KQQ03615.1 hypothetical protein ASF42_08960 [Rathayibacter sp. Leaf294]KQS12071.1 hypothetical protein ASG06_08960 [Rathayibacter sp. Leaf185]